MKTEQVIEQGVKSFLTTLDTSYTNYIYINHMLIVRDYIDHVIICLKKIPKGTEIEMFFELLSSTTQRLLIEKLGEEKGYVMWDKLMRIVDFNQNSSLLFHKTF